MTLRLVPYSSGPRGPDHARREVISIAFPGYGEMTSISLRINRTPGMLFSVSCAICFW
jgi:hypothetical protein